MANDDILSQIEPLSPADFFNLSADLLYGKSIPPSRFSARSYFLPDTSELLSEEKFADIAMAWNADEILVRVIVKKTFEGCFYPNLEIGDSVELFFDTRDVKAAGFATRFCHHFIFLPQEVNGVRCREITHFRSEDKHPLCSPEDLELNTVFEKTEYSMHVSIPAACLHGYEPSSFDRLGFTYRINRVGGQPQHFSVSSHDYVIAQNSGRWSSLKLIK